MALKSILNDHFQRHWQIMGLVLSFIAIILSFIFKFFFQLSPDLPLVILIVLVGIPAVFQIIYKLLKGDLGSDSLAAIALVTSFFLHQHLAGAVIIIMLLGGQFLETYATRKASSVLLALTQRMPNTVHHKVNDLIEEIPLKEVRIGDIICVYPYETCPVDGIVIEGQGSMDESYLTGEPYQISKAPGSFVLSGAMNGGSLLVLQAQKLASDSRYESIVSVLKEAEQKRPTIRRIGDQIGAIFAPLALLLAVLTWYFTQDAIRFLSVLVIATPCPLLIAIPITIISAISLAAKRAIIIKDPTVLERLPTCRTAIFDKTGTLTYGKPAITNIIVKPGFNRNDVLQNVASLERYSKHPLASAILQEAKKNNLSLLNAVNISEKPGQGLSGTIGKNKILITNRNKIVETHPEIVKELAPIFSGLECVILINDEYVATIQFHDLPRKESKSFISHLGPSHRMNKTILISGDRESEVKYFGALMNLTEIYASQTPEQKLAIVRDETQKADTLFMGDGINDAPALTAATVGIAFGQYSNVTSEAAGVVIMENDLSKVDELIHLSLLTRKIVLQSAVGGMLLSIIGMGFAAAGYISPIAGALLQEGIDIVAIINALQLVWQKKIDSDF